MQFNLNYLSSLGGYWIEIVWAGREGEGRGGSIRTYLENGIQVRTGNNLSRNDQNEDSTPVHRNIRLGFPENLDEILVFLRHTHTIVLLPIRITPLALVVITPTPAATSRQRWWWLGHFAPLWPDSCNCTTTEPFNSHSWAKIEELVTTSGATWKTSFSLACQRHRWLRISTSSHCNCRLKILFLIIFSE